MAAGITLHPSNIEQFQKQFNEAISTQTANAPHQEPVLEISQYLAPEDLTEGLLEELELLHPFGMNNPEPIFCIRNAIITAPVTIFSIEHFRFQVRKSTGMPLSGIAWKMANNRPPHNTPLSLAVKFIYNHWNGRKIPQLELIDWKLPENN